MTNEATIAEPESFNDLLAIARLRWLNRMRAALAERGFTTFRRGDGAWVRILGFEPQGLGEMAEFIGISRQAATKMADSLESRGYVERRGRRGRPPPSRPAPHRPRPPLRTGDHRSGRQPRRVVPCERLARRSRGGVPRAPRRSRRRRHAGRRRNRHNGTLGRLAQLGEHFLYTEGVGGSIPSPPMDGRRGAGSRSAISIFST